MAAVLFAAGLGVTCSVQLQGARPQAINRDALYNDTVFDILQRKDMIKPLVQILMLASMGTLTAGVAAEPTKISVQVLARDAKFVGTSLGGARVVLENIETGEVLAQGVTAGGTGDTPLIMQRDRKRGGSLASEGSARFDATLDINAPTKVRVTATGPQAELDSANSVSATQWVLPGKSITAGNGWLLELPGLLVNLDSTPGSVRLQNGKAELEVSVNVQMMCGCELQPKGVWDSEQFEIVAHVARQNGKVQQEVHKVALAYAGKPSTFTAKIPLQNAGDYTLSVWAHQPATGNSGVATRQLSVVD